MDAEEDQDGEEQEQESAMARDCVLPCSRQGVSSEPPDSLLPFQARWVQLCARPPDPH